MSAGPVPLFEYRPATAPVFVDVAQSAHVCGAAGCVESAGLVLVENQHERRVLCSDHAREWSA